MNPTPRPVERRPPRHGACRRHGRRAWRQLRRLVLRLLRGLLGSVRPSGVLA